MSFNETVHVLEAALAGSNVVERLYVATEFVRIVIGICTYFALRDIKNSLAQIAQQQHDED